MLNLVFPDGICSLDNSANQQNPNKGTTGTNRQYDQAQGNRGKQLNPNTVSSEDKERPGEEEDEGDVYGHDSSD